ncbi:MAG: Dynamin-like GTPase that mediates homotypic ER fusion [Cyphobasidiales sp. Tagirdzhanova-0007]|nr:MAG: Dynamin-like GTPase that mediates homotypic ER fusion [Cyphobasidiales sp. Tagirdzhanova-0007]
MNLNVDATQDVLSNPTTSLKATLAGASNEAKEAIRSIMPESANGMLKDVLSTNTDGRKDTARLQVVDELHNVGFNYSVVAVFGSQSTGKSTLLNRVFGTSFEVMNENERRQTTKGIWMCRGKGMQVVVMDVEGTDGRERGEDQASIITD